MNKQKLSKFFLLTIGGIIIGVILYRYLVLLPKFEQQGRYTIGKLNKVGFTKSSGYDAFFTYSVNHKAFKGRSGIEYKDFTREDIGKRFLILYVENEESLSNILLQYPVPDSIKSAPPNGWEELPNWTKKR